MTPFTPIFSAHGTFSRRMRMLNVKVGFRSARVKSKQVSILAFLSVLIGLGSAGVRVSFAQAVPQELSKDVAKRPSIASEKGFLRGEITAADTGKPVAGAMVRVLVEGDPANKYFLELFTDQEGQYVHELPVGDFKIFGVYSPPGYYTQDEKTFDFTTVAKKDEVTVRNFSLKKGASWKLELAQYTATKERPPIFTACIDPERMETRSCEIINTLANGKGEGVLTIPRAGGHYRFRCVQRETPNRLEIAPIDLRIENGFDPSQLQGDPEIHSADLPIRLKDKSGKVATVSGALVANRNGNAVLTFKCKVIPRSAGFKAEGIVQDEKGKPIADAKVTAAFVGEMGGHMSKFVAYSEKNGKFTIPEILLSPEYFKNNQRIKMVVIKPGFNGEESKELHLTDVQKRNMADFGTVQLKLGKTLKGKVVDNQGKPVQGAVVRCYENSFNHSHLTCRTDAKGQFQMPDLAHGPMRLWVSYGDRYANEDFNFDDKTGELIVPIRSANE